MSQGWGRHDRGRRKQEVNESMGRNRLLIEKTFVEQKIFFRLVSAKTTNDSGEMTGCSKLERCTARIGMYFLKKEKQKGLSMDERERKRG